MESRKVGAVARHQLSADVSEATKALLDRYVRDRGLKEGYLIEEAVLHHIRALEELPGDVIIPPRIVVDDQGWSAILERLEQPSKSTDTMRRLMSNE